MTSSQKTKLCARGPRRSKLALAFASFDHPKPQAASVQVGLAGLTVETIFLEATSNTRVSGGVARPCQVSGRCVCAGTAG